MAGNGKTRIFAGAGYSVSRAGEQLRGALFRRAPGDGEWEALSAGLPDKVEVRAIAVHPVNPEVIVSPHDARAMYACLSPAAFSKDGTLFRSDDLAQSWQRIDHGIKAESTLMAVCSHPRDAAQIYCVTRGGQVFGTADAGASWNEYRLPADVQDAYAVACI